MAERENEISWKKIDLDRGAEVIEGQGREIDDHGQGIETDVHDHETVTDIVEGHGHAIEIEAIAQGQGIETEIDETETGHDHKIETTEGEEGIDHDHVIDKTHVIVIEIGHVRKINRHGIRKRNHKIERKSERWDFWGFSHFLICFLDEIPI